MAERVQKTMECDRMACRNRTGVASYRVIVEKVVNVNVSGEPDIDNELILFGELCPFHLKKLIERLNATFRNTKDYTGGE